ncbi:hypothetical protein AOLI_G00122570 [Acnodon oligacanthus]
MTAPSFLSFQGNKAALLKGAASSASARPALLEAGSPAVAQSRHLPHIAPYADALHARWSRGGTGLPDSVEKD